MAEFKVAHVREQGQDMVIVFVNSNIAHKSNQEQNDIFDWLQACARMAGLAGTAVLVWDAGGGRMGFLAPPQWQNFFKSTSLRQLLGSVNKKLSCSE